MKLFKNLILLAILTLPAFTIVHMQNIENPITADNATQIRLLAQYGAGQISGMEWSFDSKLFLTYGTSGLNVYDANGLNSEPVVTDNGEIKAGFMPNSTRLYAVNEAPRDADGQLYIDADFQVTLFDITSMENVAVGYIKSPFSDNIFPVPSEHSDILFEAYHNGFWQPDKNFFNPLEEPFDYDSDCILQPLTYPDSPWIACNRQISNPVNGFMFWVTDVYDFQSKELMYRIPVENEYPSVQFTSDGKLMFIDNVLWNTKTRQVLATFENQTVEHFSADGHILLTKLVDGTIAIWEAQSATLKAIVSGFQAPIISAKVRPDGAQIALLDSESNISIWDAETGVSLFKSFGYAPRITDIHASDDNDVFFIKNDKNWLEFSVSADEIDRLNTISDYALSNEEMVLTPHNEYLTSIQSTGNIVFKDIKSGNKIGEIERLVEYEDAGPVFSPQGTWLATKAFINNSFQLWIYDMSGGPQEPFLFQIIEADAYSDEEKISLSIGQDENTLAVLGSARVNNENVSGLTVWDIETGILRFAISEQSPIFDTTDVTISDDNSLIAYGMGSIRIVDVAKERVSHVLEMPEGKLLPSLRFTPNGDILIAQYLHDYYPYLTTVLWDTATGQIIGEIAASGSSMAVSKDGNLLIFGSEDGFIEVWGLSDKTTRENISPKHGFNSTITESGVQFQFYNESSSDLINLPETQPLVYSASCETDLPQRLQMGDVGAVTANSPVTLHTSDLTKNLEVGIAYHGQLIGVTGGPICKENKAFWQIAVLPLRFGDKVDVGWSSEILDNTYLFSPLDNNTRVWATNLIPATNGDIQDTGFTARDSVSIPGLTEITDDQLTEEYLHPKGFPIRFPPGWTITVDGSRLYNNPDRLSLVAGSIFISFEYIDSAKNPHAFDDLSANPRTELVACLQKNYDNQETTSTNSLRVFIYTLSCSRPFDTGSFLGLVELANGDVIRMEARLAGSGQLPSVEGLFRNILFHLADPNTQGTLGKINRTIFVDPILLENNQLQCPNSQVSHMIVGLTGRVIPTDGTSNRLRNLPMLKNTFEIAKIPENDTFTVLEGPRCADGYAWWKVSYKGQVGWTVEGDDKDYWIETIATN